MTHPSPTFTKRNCPITAAFVQSMREQFGADVKVVMLEENGVKWPTSAETAAKQ